MRAIVNHLSKRRYVSEGMPSFFFLVIFSLLLQNYAHFFFAVRVTISERN
jgi:hypothetical protein